MAVCKQTSNWLLTVYHIIIYGVYLQQIKLLFRKHQTVFSAVVCQVFALGNTQFLIAIQLESQFIIMAVDIHIDHWHFINVNMFFYIWKQPTGNFQSSIVYVYDDD